jgi:hypothetical protein
MTLASSILHTLAQSQPVAFENDGWKWLTYVGLGVAAVVLLFVGYKLGSLISGVSYRRQLEASRSDLFTTQQGFKQLYEKEINELKAQLAKLTADNDAMQKRVEEYRKKAAGYGGLFGGGGKKSDAMYALLLENEALEEALHKQNLKLTAERSDAVQESLRNTGYRRVLMSQLLNDNRIKEYVREILEDEGKLPGAGGVDTSHRLTDQRAGSEVSNGQ